MMHTTAVHQVSFIAKQPKSRHDWNWILQVANLITDQEEEKLKQESLPDNVIPFFRKD